MPREHEIAGATDDFPYTKLFPRVLVLAMGGGPACEKERIQALGCRALRGTGGKCGEETEQRGVRITGWAVLVVLGFT